MLAASSRGKDGRRYRQVLRQPPPVRAGRGRSRVGRVLAGRRDI